MAVSTFGNDSNVIGSKDELIALLIHYGYLGYDAVNQKAFIPNSEVRQELMLAIKNGNRPELVKMVHDSELLLQKTIEGNGEYVGNYLEKLHSSKSVPSFYNNEQALRSIIHLAYMLRWMIMYRYRSYLREQVMPTWFLFLVEGVINRR